MIEKRGQIIRAIRSFFENQDFLEVETPYLVASPGMEAHLNAFRTVFIPEMGGCPANLYLPTSPEFHMKRLLSMGFKRIYQIARAFRNGETGQLHNPEFTLLEWYRTDTGYETIMDDIEHLITTVCQTTLQSSAIQRNNRQIDLSLPWKRQTVSDAWKQFADIDLSKCISSETLYEAGRKLGVSGLNSDDPWDMTYFKIFLDRIEPKLGWDCPVILYEYPASMAALARKKPDDPTVALRFELYIAGIELANAFDELTDPVEQRERCLESQQERIREGREPFPLDERFLGALETGLPPCAGIALGVDRLVMLLLDTASIQDVILFPYPS
jgi:elongation factor P--(R)-beta-lysine ligase